MQTLYDIPSPNGPGTARIEVYGDLDMAAYEWRIVSDGRTLHDTKDTAYSCPEIALRDALIWATDDTRA